MTIFNYFRLFCFLTLCWICKCDKTLLTTTETPLSEMIKITCLELTGFKALDGNNSLFRVVEVEEHMSVFLPCSYCGENVEDSPRLWKKKRRSVTATEEEVELGLDAVLEQNRVFTYPNNTLVVRGVVNDDAGLYYCQGLLQERGYDFTFSVDVIKHNVTTVTEDDKSWTDYVAETITGANENIYTSEDEEFNRLLKDVRIKVESEWDPWLPCDGCTGVRRRFAKCRIRPTLNNGNPNTVLFDQQRLLVDSVALSCHSLDLAVWFPKLGSVVGALPNYSQKQKCYDSCVGQNKSRVDPKYVLEITMEQGSSMSFVCPESSVTSNIIWKQYGVTMHPIKFKNDTRKKSKRGLFTRKDQYSLPNVFVDQMNILQVCLAEKSAHYECYVDNAIMKAIKITVVTSEDTMRERYYHFWLLTTYTFLASASIVSMGILWATINRHQFTPVDVKKVG